VGLIRNLKKRAFLLAGDVLVLLPFQGIRRPVFIIGCGRSGTTILGTSLSKHPGITYLNEPRNIWFEAYPETDIWTRKAAIRSGKLVLTDADTARKKSTKLSRLFRLSTIITGKPVLVEKLPINAFRLKFIHRIFPDARFIHIYRSGLEVAKSMEKASLRGKWFASNTYKWYQLLQLASSHEDTAGLPALCESYFDKGLLEWRLSMKAARDFFRMIPEEIYSELSYDELVDQPVAAINRLLAFIGLREDEKLNNFVLNNIKRKSDEMGPDDLTEKARIIGGELLLHSMKSAKVSQSPESAAVRTSPGSSG
jgi:hypothetical protein